MKKTLLFFLIIQGFNLFAQTNWAPIGAKWYFNRPSSTSGDFVAFESKKDSTIQGKNVRIIDVRLNGTTPVSQEYIYQNGDSIFYYNPNYNSFFLLYNFSAKPGDTITVHTSKFKPTKAFFSYYDSIIDFKYKVIAIDSILISEKWLKRQRVENLENSLWGFTKPTGGDNDYILDKVGSVTYFFGVFGGIIPEENISILRCYSETDLTYKNSAWNEECDVYTPIITNQFNDNKLIFPNPFNNQLNIMLNEPVEYIQICDINGINYFSSFPANTSFEIDTSPLNPGVYFVWIKTGQKVYTQKLIKQ